MEKQEITLMEQFITLSHLLMYKHHHGRGNHGHSLYRGQGRILSLLKIEPKMSQKKLSFLLGIRPQSMGELLVKLEQNGDITRLQSEADRRSLDIELTEKGMDAAVANEKFQACEQSMDEVFNCLNEEEQQNLATYMDRVIALLKEDMPEDQEVLLHGHHHHHEHGDHCENRAHHEHGDHHEACCGRRLEEL
jgi:DNA-binding MarR family transcriptional regulator